MRFMIFLLCTFAGYASQIPNFQHLESTRGAVIFLSSKRSGTNLISGSLIAITRKPVSWLQWGNRVFETGSKLREHPSYNRLGLPLVSQEPLMYRTHDDFEKLRKIPSHANRLIFVTRNPKELIFRKFSLQNSNYDAPDLSLIDEFLNSYIEAFAIYDAWEPQNRYLVFYEDFIRDGDQILLSLLDFMGEKPLFFEDYQMHKEEYLNDLLDSYKAQHEKNRGGASSEDGPKEIYYTKTAPVEALLQIDACIEKRAPLIWERYLKRFRTDL